MMIDLNARIAYITHVMSPTGGCTQGIPTSGLYRNSTIVYFLLMQCGLQMSIQFNTA